MTLFSIILLLIALSLPRARAQTADWTIISTPSQVTVGDYLAIAITAPAGATNDVVIVLRAGLLLVNTESSSGSFVDGRWQLDGATGSATLLLLTIVNDQARTNDDITISVTWNSIEQQTRTSLIGPAPPATPNPPGCTFMPLIQYAAH